MEPVQEQPSKPEPTTQGNEDSEEQFILQHDRPNCIGCAACEAVAPDFWEMNEDGKSDIKNGADKDDGWQERCINKKNFEENKEAADACPVNVIHLVNKQTGERLI